MRWHTVLDATLWKLLTTGAQKGLFGLKGSFITLTHCSPPAGRAEVAVSCDGLACSVVWPEEREYVILSNGGQGDLWQKLDGGPATSIAWSSAGCSYAVLHVTKVSAEHGCGQCRMGPCIGIQAGMQSPKSGVKIGRALRGSHVDHGMCRSLHKHVGSSARLLSTCTVQI